MALAYQPPGVRVSEALTPSINPLLATPASVCIVGLTQGYVTRTDVIDLTNEDAVPLTNFPADATLVEPLVSVANINDSTQSYLEGTDFEVNYSDAVNEVQTVTLEATSGTFTLAFGDETTAALDFDAATGDVQTALEDLGNLESGDIAVTGSVGNYTLTFAGQYTDTNVSEVVADGSLLGEGDTIDVHTTINGGVKGTVARVDGGAIEEGETVRVTYNYVPSYYYSPTRLDDQSSVEDLYGEAFNSDGTINSPISYAASIAFENGARDLVVQALFRRTDANDPDSAPRVATSAEVQLAATWDQTLYKLRDLEDINVIVPIIGQSYPGLVDSEQLSILQSVRRHVRYLADQQQYAIAILGEDSSSSDSYATRDTLRTHASALRSADPNIAEQLVFVSPSKFVRSNPITGQDFYVGGQYFAAAIAGLIASRSVATSLTRETVSGFTGLIDKGSKADRTSDSANGLFVAEQRGSAVQTRHAVTLDNTATQRRELPVVRAKHRMIESVRDTLDQQIIGKVIADGSAPVLVGAAVSGVLEALKGAGDLVDYSEVQARTLTLDPTTVEVRFSYKPAFPLNFINIVFSVDLTSETTTVTV